MCGPGAEHRGRPEGYRGLSTSLRFLGKPTGGQTPPTSLRVFRVRLYHYLTPETHAKPRSARSLVMSVGSSLRVFHVRPCLLPLYITSCESMRENAKSGSGCQNERSSGSEPRRCSLRYHHSLPRSLLLPEVLSMGKGRELRIESTVCWVSILDNLLYNIMGENLSNGICH